MHFENCRSSLSSLWTWSQMNSYEWMNEMNSYEFIFTLKANNVLALKWRERNNSNDLPTYYEFYKPIFYLHAMDLGKLLSYPFISFCSFFTGQKSRAHAHDLWSKILIYKKYESEKYVRIFFRYSHIPLSLIILVLLKRLIFINKLS